MVPPFGDTSYRFPAMYEVSTERKMRRIFFADIIALIIQSLDLMLTIQFIAILSLAKSCIAFAIRLLACSGDPTQ